MQSGKHLFNRIKSQNLYHSSQEYFNNLVTYYIELLDFHFGRIIIYFDGKSPFYIRKKTFQQQKHNPKRDQLQKEKEKKYPDENANFKSGDGGEVGLYKL